MSTPTSAALITIEGLPLLEALEERLDRKALKPATTEMGRVQW